MSLPSVLVIGCGSIGERHLRCFQKSGRVRVAGCDPVPAVRERIAATYGVAVQADWEAALAAGGHAAVVICTPAPLHVRIARRALAAGAHVLIEKPLSQSIESVDDLLREAAAGPGRVAMAYVYHVFPFLAQPRAFLAGGALGPVLQGTYVGGQPFHLLRQGYARTYYRDRQQGGGAIQDALTHIANWMESVLGPTETVFCDCAHLAVPEVTVEDTVHVVARQRAGTLVSYALNQYQAENEATIRLHTAQGTVCIEFHRQRWGVIRHGSTEWEWHDGAVTERDSHFIAQANAFLDLMDGKPSRLCSLEAGAQTLRFNLAALASAERGAIVACRDVTAR